VKFGWRTNPFTLIILPDLMVGYAEQSTSLLSHIYNFHKFALVTGHTGSGKTTLLQWLNYQIKAFKKFKSCYIPKAPKTNEELLKIILKFFRPNFLDRIRFRNLSLFDVSDYLKHKIGSKHLVLLLDESHESSIEVLEWLRTIIDSIPNVTIVMAGLPKFERILETKLPTLFMRITTKVYLDSLNRDETEDLIRRRIERSGGEGIKPFTVEAIDEIFRITGGFPREIIKTCDKLVMEAAAKNLTTITPQFVKEVISPAEVEEEKIEVILTPKQKRILKILNENPRSIPSVIVEKLGIKYEKRGNAVRAVNNILKRLMREGLVNRQKVGNAYAYSLTGKGKTLFTEA